MAPVLRCANVSQSLLLQRVQEAELPALRVGMSRWRGDVALGWGPLLDVLSR